MTKYKYFKSKNYRSNVNLVVESDIVEVSDQTSEGGDFIPLSGTEVGSPVTGDIEFQSGFGLFFDDTDDSGARYKVIQESGVIFIIDIDSGKSIQIAPNTGFQIDTIDDVSGISSTKIHSLVDPTNSYIYAQRDYVNSIIIDSATTAINNRKYTSIATLTVTDPTPVEGQGYIVFVRNGTTTIDSVGYTSGNLIYRIYQGGAWSSTVFGVSAPINTATQTALDKGVKQITRSSGSNISVTTSEHLLFSFLIPANTLNEEKINVISFFVERATSTSQTSTLRMYTSNDENLLGNLFATAFASGAARNIRNFKRLFEISGGILDPLRIPVGNNVLSNDGSQNNINPTTTSITFDISEDNWIHVTAQNSDFTMNVQVFKSFLQYE